MAIEQFLGKAMRGIRAGEAHLFSNKPPFARIPRTLQLASPAFADGAAIPARFTAIGEEIFPPLHWEGVPAGCKQLLLVVEDADAPLPRPIVHCIVYGIQAATRELPEGSVPRRHCWKQDATLPGIHVGSNTLGSPAWAGPRPVASHGVHRYFFQLFALSAVLELNEPPRKKELLRAAAGKVMAVGVLVGTFVRE